MKLEVGKTYKDASGRKVQIVYYTKPLKDPYYDRSRSESYLGVVKGPEISYWYYPDGVHFNSSMTSVHNLLKEWSEPIVHKRDVLWVRSSTGFIYCTLVHIGSELPLSERELHRQTVTYTEPEK